VNFGGTNELGSGPGLRRASAGAALTGSSAGASNPTMAADVEVRGGWRLSCGRGRTAALQPLERAREARGPSTASSSPSGSGAALEAGWRSAECGRRQVVVEEIRRAGMRVALAGIHFTVHTGLTGSGPFIKFDSGDI
jgi:hypothetical protein